MISRSAREGNFFRQSRIQLDHIEARCGDKSLTTAEKENGDESLTWQRSPAESSGLYCQSERQKRIERGEEQKSLFRPPELLVSFTGLITSHYAKHAVPWPSCAQHILTRFTSTAISLESSEKKRDEGILSRMRNEIKKREVVMQIERV